MSKTTVELQAPSVGESVTEVEVAQWLKAEGDAVQKDESVLVLDTDKATVDVPSPVTGRLIRLLKKKGERVKVGEVLGEIEAGDEASPAAQTDAPKAAPATPSPAPVQVAPDVTPPPVSAVLSKGSKPAPGTPPRPAPPESDPADQAAARSTPPATAGRGPSPGVPGFPPGTSPKTSPAKLEERAEEIVPMSLLRRKIAARLVAAQHTGALLTTFNEIDMSMLMALRREQQEQFQARYKIKLGLMSFFVKAVIAALKEVPQLNAEIRGTDIVYRNYHDISIAIGGGRGLVVPVLRQAGGMSFAEIELAIADFARRVQNDQIKPDELHGGTFTITNGGIYGSLLSTPLVNAPQSGVLGMHTIQDRPVALHGQVVIRPMMYVALTYDHRLVDGREAVQFLRRVKESIESPVRMLIEL